MLQFIILTSLVASALAGGYGSGYGSSSGFSSSSLMGSMGPSLGLGSMGSSSLGMGSMGSSSFGMGSSLGMGSMGSLSMGSMGMGSQFLGGLSSGYSGGYSGGLIPAAVQSRRSIQFLDMPSTMQAPLPLTIEAPANTQPLNFLFRAKSSPLVVDQTFESTPGSYQESASMDEPQIRVHTVTRPVIQKLNEIISPFRQIRQEVQPVQEQMQTLVTRGTNQGYSGGYAPAATTGSSSFTMSMGAAKPSYGGFAMTSMPKPTLTAY